MHAHKECYAHLNNAIHVRNKLVCTYFQQHYQSSADILADFWVLITSQGKEILLCKNK